MILSILLLLLISRMMTIDDDDDDDDDDDEGRATVCGLVEYVMVIYDPTSPGLFQQRWYSDCNVNQRTPLLLLRMMGRSYVKTHSMSLLVAVTRFLPLWFCQRTRCGKRMSFPQISWMQVPQFQAWHCLQSIHPRLSSRIYQTQTPFMSQTWHQILTKWQLGQWLLPRQWRLLPYRLALQPLVQ